MKNYYELLEVNKNASSEIINKVYKYKIKQTHPDLFQGDEKLKAEELTKELTEAYNILSNEEKRKEYDASLNEKELNLEQLIYTNELYKKENEILRADLNRKNELISTYLNTINLNNYSDNMQNDNTLLNQKSYLNNLINKNNENQEYNSNIPFYKYMLHTLKDIFIKILVIIIFIILCIILISTITKTNPFELFYTSFFK